MTSYLLAGCLAYGAWILLALAASARTGTILGQLWSPVHLFHGVVRGVDSRPYERRMAGLLVRRAEVSPEDATRG